MTFLLDTNCFSDLMRENSGCVGRLARLTDDDRVIICTIVRGEVCYGLERVPQGRRRRVLGAKAARLFEAIPCESVPPDAADHYAHIKINREAAGLSLDENDLWIAACAIALDATLVTRDRDFDQIEGLRIECWSE